MNTKYLWNLRWLEKYVFYQLNLLKLKITLCEFYAWMAIFAADTQRWRNLNHFHSSHHCSQWMRAWWAVCWVRPIHTYCTNVRSHIFPPRQGMRTLKSKLMTWQKIRTDSWVPWSLIKIDSIPKIIGFSYLCIEWYFHDFIFRFHQCIAIHIFFDPTIEFGPL